MPKFFRIFTVNTSLDAGDIAALIASLLQSYAVVAAPNPLYNTLVWNNCFPEAFVIDAHLTCWVFSYKWFIFDHQIVIFTTNVILTILTSVLCHEKICRSAYVKAVKQLAHKHSRVEAWYSYRLLHKRVVGVWVLTRSHRCWTRYWHLQLTFPKAGFHMIMLLFIWVSCYEKEPFW